ncbi:MAG: SAM-dependent methyltransferase [Nitrospirales bacterium]
MAVCLYDPTHGFYTQGPSIGSPEGPFDTNVKFPAFAFALAQAVKQVDDILGANTRILELGGGTGQLGKSIVNFLGGQRNYVVVDLSSGLRVRQNEAGLQTVEDLMQVPSGPTVVFGNEILDALPVHKVMGIGQGNVLEFFVDLDEDGELFEILQPPSTPALQAKLNELHISLGRGQVGEVCLELRSVFQKLGSIVDPGYLIFIDYGDTASNLYSFQRRNGTLRSYYRQHQIYDFFYAPGEQDLTADVDFTAVSHEAQAVGFDGGTLLSQGSWLTNLGIHSYAKDEKALAVIEHEVNVLTKATQLGSAFDVLIFQTKGLPVGPGIGDATEPVKISHRLPSSPTVSIDTPGNRRLHLKW